MSAEVIERVVTGHQRPLRRGNLGDLVFRPAVQRVDLLQIQAGPGAIFGLVYGIVQADRFKDIVDIDFRVGGREPSMGIIDRLVFYFQLERLDAIRASDELVQLASLFGQIAHPGAALQVQTVLGT